MAGPTLAPPPRRIGSLADPMFSRRPIGNKKKAAPPRHQPEEPKCCDSPRIEDEDGHKVCKNCFTEIAESNIVADVTFEEDSRGAHTVQGGYIGDNARHAKTLGAAARRLGGDQRNSIQEIEANGRRALSALCPRLGISDNVTSQATQLFIIASQHRFSSGRRTDEVAASCLYAACRRQKENTVMLIDIAELIQINVFRLGEVYKDMCTRLYLEEANGVGASGVGRQYLVEVEYLVMKYCRKLEFGDETRQVAEDAVKILKRMKRDWMVTGRHPAGLCGACIILAARMNNFRRSTREVVLVAKVADSTLAKRVEEFRRTKAAALTVEQFREFGVRLKGQSDPPIIYESELRKQKQLTKKRKRADDAAARRDQSDATDDSSEAISATGDRMSKRQKTNSALPTPTSSQHTIPSQPASLPAQQTSEHSRIAHSDPSQFDSDGFRIPQRPQEASAQDQQQPQDQEVRRKRGRPKKQVQAPIVITDEELATEEELRREIIEVLEDEQVIESRDEVQQARDEQRAKVIAEQQKALAAEATQQRRDEEGITWFNGSTNDDTSEFVTAEDLEKEFENDPEVINCLLSPAEQEIKERIWVTFNEDWLRVQHEKRLLAEVARVNPPPNRRGAKGGKKKKKGRMGDGTLLAEATTPIETPADASIAMLQARASASFSRNLDYNILSMIYGGRSRSSSQAGGVERIAAAGDTEGATANGRDSSRGGSPAGTETTRAEEQDDSQEEQGDEPIETNAASQQHKDQAVVEPAPPEATTNIDGNDDDGYESENEDDRPRSWFASGGGEDDEDDYDRALDITSGRYEDFEHQFDGEDDY